MPAIKALKIYILSTLLKQPYIFSTNDYEVEPSETRRYRNSNYRFLHKQQQLPSNLFCNYTKVLYL